MINEGVRIVLPSGAISETLGGVSARDEMAVILVVVGGAAVVGQSFLAGHGVVVLLRQQCRSWSSGTVRSQEDEAHRAQAAHRAQVGGCLKIGTKDNEADLLTKFVTFAVLEALTRSLGLRPVDATS